MPHNPANTARLGVSVSRDLQAKIQVQAKLQRRSVSNFVENLIEEYFEQMPEDQCELLWNQWLSTLDPKESEDHLRFVDPTASAKERVKKFLVAH